MYKLVFTLFLKRKYREQALIPERKVERGTSANSTYFLEKGESNRVPMLLVMKNIDKVGTV